MGGIGPRLLILSASVVTKSITLIAPKCLLHGIFPKAWKEAKVTPLYKSGPRDEINNYRPISILPTSSKLIEKFIQVHLFSYLNDFGVNNKTQSRFRTRYSTETALTLITENWLKALNEDKIIGTIIVDFRKAFDLLL